MRRRRALALFGGFATLSGCSAIGGSETATPSAAPSDGTTPAPATTDELEVVGVDAPESVEVNAPYEFTLRVRNPTDRPGAFQSRLSLRIGDGEWNHLEGGVGAEVPPGATRELSTSLPPIAFLNTYDLRLDAVERSWTFETVARRLPFGDGFETPRSLTVTVLGGSFTTSYAGGGNESDARTPPSGSKWVVVRVEVENPGDEVVTFPPLGAFTLLTDGSEHAVRLSDPNDGVELSMDRARIEIPFVVPEDVTGDELTVRWEPVYGDRRTAAAWSAQSD